VVGYLLLFEFINAEIKLKKIVLILAVFVLFNFGCAEDKASTSNLNWTTNLEQAIELAKKENKAVLVNFTGSDWCRWCFKLRDEVFVQTDFKNYADENLVLVVIDFPRNKSQSNETKLYNQSIAQQFGIQGFPTIVIFNNEGVPVAKTGYQPGGASNYVNHIKSFLDS
jgi:thioredoxin-related protein